MTNHPVYTDSKNNIFREHYFTLCKKMGEEPAKKAIIAQQLKQMGVPSDPLGLMSSQLKVQMEGKFLSLEVEQSIIDEGHVLIHVDKEDWNSAVSAKTLEDMSISYFAFPFPSGTIMMGDLPINFATGFDDNGEKKLTVSIHAEKGTFSLILVSNSTIGKRIDGWEDENKEVVFSVLSVLLYIATYKKDKRRVSHLSGERSQGSNKKKVPKHRISFINLKQLGESKQSTSSGGGGKSDKLWRVRAHWRNQPFGKRGEGRKRAVWVDSFWKGSGKEQIEKVYKI